MQDIVANRARISLRSKMRIAWRAFRDNGPAWSVMFAIYYLSSTMAHKASGGMTRLRLRRGIPGLNSVALNREIWNSWDWKAEGTEWTVSDTWYQGCVKNVLQRWIPTGSLVLEVGPGGGRWTAPLIEIAEHYTGIDVSSAAIDVCRQRFKHAPNAKFLVGSGTDLSDVGDATVDRIWSFDVFVHINAVDVRRYLDEFARVLRPGGIAIIHHGAVGGALGGWRSDLTAEKMQGYLYERGFESHASIDRWDDDLGDVAKLSGYGDLISIFSRPEARSGEAATGPGPARSRRLNQGP